MYLRPRGHRAAVAAVITSVVAACGGSGPATSTSYLPTTTARTALPGATPGVSASAAVSASAPVTAAADPCALAPAGHVAPVIPANFVTALAFAPDGRLFYTERTGTVRVYENGASHIFATVHTVTAERDGSYSERGLLGLALSTTFAQDHLVFAFYSDADYAHQRVIRWRDCAGIATDAAVIVTLPAGGDCCHKGGRLAVGPDGMLYVTLGDEHVAGAAQNTADWRGKVLRYTRGGGIPADNPFGATNPVWAYGLRNPFGIAFSSSGQLGVTSNGPSGDAGSPSTGYDLAITNLQRGAGYLWPDCYGYSHPLATSTCPAGEFAPDWSSERSTYVPTGAAFIDDQGPMVLASHFVFATYAYGLQILTPGSPHATVVSGNSHCRLAVVQSPAHSVYCADASAVYAIG